MGSIVAGAVVYGATVIGRVGDIKHIEARVAENQVSIEAMPDRYVPRAELMSALKNIEQRLGRIEDKLDRKQVR